MWCSILGNNFLTHSSTTPIFLLYIFIEGVHPHQVWLVCFLVFVLFFFPPSISYIEGCFPLVGVVWFSGFVEKKVGGKHTIEEEKRTEPSQKKTTTII